MELVRVPQTWLAIVMTSPTRGFCLIALEQEVLLFMFFFDA